MQPRQNMQPKSLGSKKAKKLAKKLRNLSPLDTYKKCAKAAKLAAKLYIAIHGLKQLRKFYAPQA